MVTEQVWDGVSADRCTEADRGQRGWILSEGTARVQASEAGSTWIRIRDPRWRQRGGRGAWEQEQR